MSGLEGFTSRVSYSGQDLDNQEGNSSVQSGLSGFESQIKYSDSEEKSVPDYGEVFADKSFSPFSDLVRSAQKKKGEVAESRKSLEKGDIGRVEFETVRAGKVVGLAGDIQFTPISIALQGVPDAIKEPASEAIGVLFNSDIIGKGMDVYNKWAEENPDTNRLVESVVNILAFAIPVKMKKSLADGDILKTNKSKFSKNLEIAGGKQVREKLKKFTDELILPIVTTKEAERRVASMVVPKGLGSDKYVLSNSEKIVSATIAKIDGVSPSNHMQKNYNIIRDYNYKIGNELVIKLDKMNLQPLVSNPSKTIDEVMATLSKTNQILASVGKGRKEAIINKAKELLEGVRTPAGLLKARKEFDKVMLERVDTRLLTDIAAGDKLVVETVRGAMNTVLHESVPSGVKGILSRQSKMFDAMYNIVPKAAKQSNSVVGRAWDKIKTLQGAKQALILGGAGILGYNAMATLTAVAPFLVAGAVIAPITYYSGRLVAKVGTIQTMSRMVNVLEKSLKVTVNTVEKKEIAALILSLRSTLANVTVEKEDKETTNVSR